MSIFNKVFMPSVGSNMFDLSHDVKLSFNMGELVPTCVMDVLPGDKITIGVEQMLRFQPLLAPIMHQVDVTTHYFFVPNRIVWPSWEKFITGEEDVLAPYLPVGQTLGVVNPGTLADYMGVPTGTYDDLLQINAIPFAAYAMIWDEFYRDQNLQDEIFNQLVDGDNSVNYLNQAISPCQHRAWNHDYFTSCLPFAQKGDEVELPLLQDQKVDVTLKAQNPLETQRIRNATSGAAINADLDATGSTTVGEPQESGVPLTLDPNGSWEIDVSDEVTTVNVLRRAFKLQEWLEKNARGGTRYIENIMAHFGVRSSDKRMQRPEYIGGSKGRMTISEVLTTANQARRDGSGGAAPILPNGSMTGHGISVSGGNTFNYKAEEHGFIIGITNVQPKTAYQQGLSKMFSRPDKLDYFWPSFANIGEQAVKVKELWAKGTTAEQEEVFGYIPRYSEYRYMCNRVAGDFKDTLDFWHMGRIFENKPVLNEEFIKCDPTDRNFAVTDEDEHKILAHIFNNIKAVRKLPKFAIPTI